jgi:hypothetical protein
MKAARRWWFKQGPPPGGPFFFSCRLQMPQMSRLRRPLARQREPARRAGHDNRRLA